LNPVAAKVTETPETSDDTSIKQRMDHAEAENNTAKLESAKGGSVVGSQAVAGAEDSQQLCPIEGRCGLDSTWLYGSFGEGEGPASHRIPPLDSKTPRATLGFASSSSIKSLVYIRFDRQGET
jgi:hypothetical protein